MSSTRQILYGPYGITRTCIRRYAEAECPFFSS
ncbi:MAG: hypothetical protein J5651_08350 [Salinivirgaceae bacterium]|nr:hypothetical protein [Salinivirgaceae bacterium]MBO7595030.1 hypothetical protein [Salinivirgaceae bacterium]